MIIEESATQSRIKRNNPTEEERKKRFKKICKMISKVLAYV